MTAMTILAALSAAVAVGLASWLLWTKFDPVRRQARQNLQRVGTSQTHDDVATLQVESSLETLARKLTPSPLLHYLQRQYILAGRPANWTVGTLVTLKFLWLILALVGILAVVLTSPPPFLAFLALLVAVGGYFLPELLLKNEGQKRSEQIERELADTLDQMTIAIEAGLGFDAAMARAGQNGKGPLAEELVRTLQEISMGYSRRQAFESLTKRTDAPDLRRFVRAVIQADSYGVSMAGVLYTQADEMRTKRRQRAEEKAQKVPVKVLLPMMLFILPVLFIVVLGPAILNMMETFGGK
ncbi:MAG TPA: type II secretion system F family protein [Enteractinococcus sp.]